MRDIYLNAKGAVACVVVRTKEGDESIGTAFHIGDGYFVTAKHVVEGNVILAVSITQSLGSSSGYHSNHLTDDLRPRTLSLLEGPKLADGDVDVAVLRVKAENAIPSIRLSSIDDIYLSEENVILSSVVCFGYPPIPLTTHPFQVAVDGRINALIKVRGSDYLTYVISATSRGGFSGGPVLDESGVAIGLVTEALVRNDSGAETGFFTCLSISAAASLALTAGWSPDDKTFYRNIEALAWVKMALPTTNKLNPHSHDVSIYVHDDDRDVYVGFAGNDTEIINVAEAAFSAICPLHEQRIEEGENLWLPKENPPYFELQNAAKAARDSLIKRGFLVVSERFSEGWAYHHTSQLT